jgi:tetratricopeptide (TPR) repeat protein
MTWQRPLRKSSVSGHNILSNRGHEKMFVSADLIHDMLRFPKLLKLLLVKALGGIPEAAKLFDEIPAWLYGVFAVFFFLLFFFTIMQIISAVHRKAMLKVRGSRLGAAKEKRRLFSEAKRAARKKDFSRASELFLSIGEDAMAAEALEKGEMYAKAGQVYDQMGNTDKAIELYEKAGELGWLAEALRRRGLHQKAAEIYIMAGKKLLAAEAYEAAGANVLAAGLFEEAGHTVSAARHYEQAGNFEKAAALYDRAYIEGASSQESLAPERLKRLDEFSVKAGEYYTRSGQFDKAAETFARSRSFIRAGEASLAAGHRAKAAEYFLSGGEYETAAGIYREDGNTTKACEAMAEKHLSEGESARAGEMYMEAGDYLKAAELFDVSGEYVKAGEAYMAAGEYAVASEMFLKGEDLTRAADACEKGGDLKGAADIHMRLGDTVRATAIIERSGDFMRAAGLYRELGMPDRELATLQKVSSGDPGFVSASVRLAEHFQAQGDLKLSAEKYVQAIGGAEPDSGNVDLFYGLATVHEAAKRYADAEKFYHKVQLVDFRYKDVEERVANCAQYVSQSMPDTAPGQDDNSATRIRAEEAAKRYTVLGEVGRGGMGIVYKARDNNLNRIIALKLLPKSISDNPKAVMRFSAEARSAAQLNHTNIVTLYDFQQAGDKSFITMEYVEGVTLKKLMGMVDKLPIIKSLKVIYQCCQGLDYAHKKGIIHRDIKPSNIMISKQNIVKIMDFGLAKILGEETLSDAGTVSGTLLYMSPEQLLGEKVDPATDIYALGLVLYELVAGEHPFAKGDAAYHHVHTVPKPPNELRPDIPENLSAIILKCLEKDRTTRFESARQLALALREVPVQ